MVVFGSWSLFEVITGEFGLLSYNNLQVRDHPIIFCGVLYVDLAHYK